MVQKSCAFDARAAKIVRLAIEALTVVCHTATHALVMIHLIVGDGEGLSPIVVLPLLPSTTVLPLLGRIR